MYVAIQKVLNFLTTEGTVLILHPYYNPSNRVNATVAVLYCVVVIPCTVMLEQSIVFQHAKVFQALQALVNLRKAAKCAEFGKMRIKRKFVWKRLSRDSNLAESISYHDESVRTTPGTIWN